MRSDREYLNELSNISLKIHYQFFESEKTMLWTIFVILLVMWALGLATGATLNGFIHILLIIAIVVVLLRVIQGRQLV